RWLLYLVYVCER
ncbi:LOW QUALITY PROTEIN: hypothetical protein BSCG_08001, partial (plasmid) [Bacteroides sp. 2_2_4]